MTRPLVCFSRHIYKEDMSSSLGDVIKNIRYIWQQMKNDTTMQRAVYMYYNSTGVLFWLPLIAAAFYTYHLAYQTFPYTASSFLLGSGALLLLSMGSYLWMTQNVMS